MKHFLLFVFALFLLPFALSVEATEPNPVEKPGWKLTFQDEFDRPLLNDLYWYAAYRTGQREYLTRPGGKGLSPSLKFHDNNALYKIEDGLLKLIIDETVPPRLNKTDLAVSCLTTSDHRFGKDMTEYQVLEKFAQKYGWFETRCKSIKGSGLYTAFWLHQTDPTDQEFTLDGHWGRDHVVEIDIFELVGKEATEGVGLFNVFFPKTKDGYSQHRTATEPLQDFPCEHNKYKTGFDPSQDFHTYAMEWQEGEINWYIDNKKTLTYRGETPQKKMFILLALFQGRGGWSGEVSKDQTYPVIFEVDYVRVYEKE